MFGVNMTTMTETIQRYRDIDDDWRWRLIGADGHPLADGELAFTAADELDDHLDRLRQAVPAAAVVDEPGRCPVAGDACIVRTTGHDDEWRWQLFIDATTVAKSGEGYADRDALDAAIERTQAAIADATVSTWDP